MHPALTLLLVEVVGEDVAEKFVDVLVRREEDMPRLVERESILDDRAAQSAGAGMAVGEDEIGVVQVQAGAQAGGASADDQVPGIGGRACGEPGLRAVPPVGAEPIERL